MKRYTFRYIEEILKDYPDIDKHIHEREMELRYSVLPADENVGGGRAENKLSEPVLNMMITIDTDRRLYNLKRNQKAIDDTLDEFGNDTYVIINELYFKKHQEFTLNGLVQNHKVLVGKDKAYKLRNDFFESLARRLGLIS